MMRTLLVITAVVIAASAFAADDFLYQGSFLWNDIRGVVFKDNYFFCAFNDGIGSINIDLDFSKKKLVSQLEIGHAPLRLLLFGSTLVVGNEDGTVSLVDVTDPENMVLVGSFSPGYELYDLAILDGYLYAAAEYDGLFRYDISDPADIHFDDSSMAGIRDIDLLVRDSFLYVLDDYNGILVYQPGPDSIGAPVAELLLPYQAVAFTLALDTVYAAVRPNGYMVADMADPYQPEYLELRTSMLRGDNIVRTPEGLVLANTQGGFELMYEGESGPIDHIFPVSGIRGYPDVFTYDGRRHIVYPHLSSGFVVFDIDVPDYIDVESPDMVYASPGPITQLAFINSRLHVIGTYNWYEMYDLSDPGRPFRSGTMINPPYRPAGVCHREETLYVADLATNGIFPAIDAGSGNPSPKPPFFFLADSIARPYLIPDYFPAGDLLYFHNESDINGSLLSDSGFIVPNLMSWTFALGVTAALVYDSVLYRADDKGLLHAYMIDPDDYVLTEITQTPIPGKTRRLIRVDTLLYAGAGGLVTFNIVDPLFPVQVDYYADARTISDMHLYDSRLVTAGRDGVHVFDISGGGPQLLFNGGEAATVAAFDGETLAAGDGRSVKVYTLPPVDADEVPLPAAYSEPRLTGYPNPFNPSVTLTLHNFGVSRTPAIIDVYDILGRRVNRLTAYPAADNHRAVKWDGRDGDGNRLSSGVYFFRARLEDKTAVYKAILMK